MPARILNGNRIRDQILLEVEAEVETLTAQGIRPGLAAVRVGDDPASEIYVRNKIKACEKVGIHSEHITPLATATTEELLGLVDDLNQRDEIDGILVQLPLPDQVDAAKVLLAVSPQKDVDGFHPFNVGALVTKRPAPIPCTPAGLIQILKRSEIPISGKRAVIVGRSDIVGKPAGFLLLHENATVTICHSKTENLPAVAREADILVAAIGPPGVRYARLHQARRHRSRCRNQQPHRRRAGRVDLLRTAQEARALPGERFCSGGRRPPQGCG